MSLLLGLVGIYGVIAYAVTQRTREIGIRAALGAQPRELQRMFIRHGVGLAVVGVCCGLGVALARDAADVLAFVRSVSPLDPVTLVAVVGGADRVGRDRQLRAGAQRHGNRPRRGAAGRVRPWASVYGGLDESAAGSSAAERARPVAVGLEIS